MRKAILAVAAGLAGALPLRNEGARAFDIENDVRVSSGLKGWASTWDSWRPETVFFDNGPIRVAQTVRSGTRFALTPNVSVVAQQKFLLSASYLAPESYPLTGALDTNSLVGSRREFDANAGYYVFPGVAVTLGYKQIQQAYGQGTYKWTGPTAGLAGSAEISGNWSLYGSLAYGPLKLRLPAGAADALGNTSFQSTYAVGEFGLAYTLPVRSFLKAARLTIGYRAQTLSTRGYFLNHGGPLGDPEERDYTQGATVGLSASF